MPLSFQPDDAIIPAQPARRSFRYTTNISVLAALLGHGNEKKLPNTILKNISSTGAGIASPVILPIGEVISLHFCLPESGLPFRATATVVWSDSAGHCGVHFQQVSESHLQRLETWLDGKAAEWKAVSHGQYLPVGSRISEFQM